LSSGIGDGRHAFRACIPKGFVDDAELSNFDVYTALRPSFSQTTSDGVRSPRTSMRSGPRSSRMAYRFVRVVNKLDFLHLCRGPSDPSGGPSTSFQVPPGSRAKITIGDQPCSGLTRPALVDALAEFFLTLAHLCQQCRTRPTTASPLATALCEGRASQAACSAPPQP
jgi:hypothetical protein